MANTIPSFDETIDKISKQMIQDINRQYIYPTIKPDGSYDKLPAYHSYRVEDGVQLTVTQDGTIQYVNHNSGWRWVQQDPWAPYRNGGNMPDPKKDREIAALSRQVLELENELGKFRVANRRLTRQRAAARRKATILTKVVKQLKGMLREAYLHIDAVRGMREAVKDAVSD